ncbi:malectin-B-like [Centruroides sculpturatus]|uniref:malectin-B-like n=1 Tax=Centruroides sculpturatus TaxID=218467 RepID=UPI000C6DFF3F|nr:malectin-B-like [Centruroides sculpturatus]
MKSFHFIQVTIELLFNVLCVLQLVDVAFGIGEVIYAINCGGEVHVDGHGIHYRRDPLHGKVGTASDYGKQLIISRVPRSDQILYQTERYHHMTFGYEIPVNKDGDYVLILKFCEVYFSSPGMKFRVFYVSSSVRTVGVENIGYRDNPKINAIYVMRGTLNDVPQLPPLSQGEEKDEEEEELQTEKKSSQVRRPSGPRSPNPYETDDNSTMLPIFVAVGAFIPLLFCLCRL